jgi:hypothetical protein
MNPPDNEPESILKRLGKNIDVRKIFAITPSAKFMKENGINGINSVKENVLAIKDNFMGKDNGRGSTTIIGSLYNILLSIIDLIMSLFRPPGVAEISFIVFAILFGFIFFQATVAKIGNNNISQFTGYCMWAWIFLLLIIIVVNRLIIFISTR